MKKKTKYLLYTLIFIFVCLVIFYPFYSNGKSLILNDDGTKQHFIIFSDYVTMIKNIVFNGGNFRTFDFSMGLGSDVIAQYSYYIIGDLFSYLGIFFSESIYPYVYSGLIILRIFCVGLSMLYFCSYKKLSNYKGLVSALIYTFSAFVLYASVRHPYFTNAMILLPLFLVGVEKLIKEDKKLFLTVISFFTILSNFYFCYMIVVLGFIYALLIFFFDNPNKSLKNFITKILWAGICFLIGFSLSSIVLIPTLYTYLNLDTSMRNVLDSLTYPFNYYQSLISSFVTTDTSFWVTIGVLPLCIMLLPIIVKNIKKNKVELLYLIILILFLLFPIFGSLMNGGSFPTNRWSFGLILILSFGSIKVLKDNLIFNRNELKMMLFAIIIYLELFFLVKNFDIVFLIELLLSFLFLFTFFIQSRFKTKYMAKIILILLIIGGISFNGLYLYSGHGKKYAKNFINYDEVESYYDDMNNLINQDEVINDLLEEDNSFYRITRVPSKIHNLSILYNYNSLGGYLSLINGGGNFSSDLNNIEYRSASSIRNFDNRTIATTFLGNKYYLALSDTNVPYGYEKYKEYDDSNIIIYKNKYYLSPFIFYDSYISSDEYNDLSSLEKETSILNSVSIDDDVISTIDMEYDNNCEIEVKEVSCSIDLDGNTYIQTDDNSINIDCEGVKNSEIYVEINNFNFVRKTDYWINVTRGNYINSNYVFSEETSAYYVDTDKLLFNLGYVKDLDELDINITLNKKGTYTLDGIKVYAISMDNYEESIEELQEISFEIDSYSDTYISGSINNDKNGILELTSDYSVGWDVYVDGKKVDTFITNNSFIGIYLEAGSHEIEFKYTTPYSSLSKVLTVFGIIGLAFIIYIERKMKIP